MKNLTRALKWFIAIVISMVCFIGWLISVLWIYAGIRSDPEPGFILRTTTLGGIIVCLAVSYTYIVKRSANRMRVRQIYVIISLLVVYVYIFSEYQAVHVFSEYQKPQEEMAIRDVCARFEQAIAQEDFETAYEFMSPDYRQVHSLAKFERDYRGFTCSRYTRVSISYLATSRASMRGGGSLIHATYLEKLNHQWYFTGEYRLFQG